MKLKELFIDWLTESRYSRSLELRCAELRHDYTERLAEKDEQIKLLKAELLFTKRENQQFMQLLIPRLAPSPVAPRPEPEFDMPLDWQSQLQQLVQAEEKEIQET